MTDRKSTKRPQPATRHGQLAVHTLTAETGAAVAKLVRVIRRPTFQGQPQALRLWHVGATLRELLDEVHPAQGDGFLQAVSTGLQRIVGGGYAPPTLYFAMQLSASVPASTAGRVGATGVLKCVLCLDTDQRQFYLRLFERDRPSTRTMQRLVAGNTYGTAGGRVDRVATVNAPELSQKQVAKLIAKRITELQTILRVQAQGRRARGAAGRLSLERDRRGRWAWRTSGDDGAPVAVPAGSPGLGVLTKGI